MIATFYVGDAIKVMSKLPEKSVSMVIPSTMRGCLNQLLSLAVGWKSSLLPKMAVGFGVLRWTTTDTASSSIRSMGAKCMSGRIDGPSSILSVPFVTVKSLCTCVTRRDVSTRTTWTPGHRSITTTTRSQRIGTQRFGATHSIVPGKRIAFTATRSRVGISGSIPRLAIGAVAGVPLIELGRSTTAPAERGW